MMQTLELYFKLSHLLRYFLIKNVILSQLPVLPVEPYPTTPTLSTLVGVLVSGAGF